MRLIDADALKECVRDDTPEGWAIGHLIDIQPTAYDVEKVVVQIKESYGACDECRGYKSHECSSAHCQIREVIDIVRNGGKG